MATQFAHAQTRVLPFFDKLIRFRVDADILENGLKTLLVWTHRNAGEGGAWGQAPLLPFAKGGKGAKVPFS